MGPTDSTSSGKTTTYEVRRPHLNPFIGYSGSDRDRSTCFGHGNDVVVTAEGSPGSPFPGPEGVVSAVLVVVEPAGADVEVHTVDDGMTLDTTVVDDGAGGNSSAGAFHLEGPPREGTATLRAAAAMKIARISPAERVKCTWSMYEAASRAGAVRSHSARVQRVCVGHQDRSTSLYRPTFSTHRSPGRAAAVTNTNGPLVASTALIHRRTQVSSPNMPASLVPRAMTVTLAAGASSDHVSRSSSPEGRHVGFPGSGSWRRTISIDVPPDPKHCHPSDRDRADSPSTIDSHPR